MEHDSVPGEQRISFVCLFVLRKVKLFSFQMLASLKQQYVELLSDIGFIESGIRLRDVERAARGGSDGVADVTGIEVRTSKIELVKSDKMR